MTPRQDPGARRQAILGEQKRRDDYRAALRVMFECAGDSLAAMQAKNLDPARVLRAVELTAIQCGDLVADEVFRWTFTEWREKYRRNPWTGDPLPAEQRPIEVAAEL